MPKFHSHSYLPIFSLFWPTKLVYKIAENAPQVDVAGAPDYKTRMEAEVKKIDKALRNKESLKTAVEKARNNIRGISQEVLGTIQGEAKLVKALERAAWESEKQIQMNMRHYEQIALIVSAETTVDTYKKTLEDYRKKPSYEIASMVTFQNNAKTLLAEAHRWRTSYKLFADLAEQGKQVADGFDVMATAFGVEAQNIVSYYENLGKNPELKGALNDLNNGINTLHYTQLDNLQKAALIYRNIFQDALIKTNQTASENKNFIAFLENKIAEIDAGLDNLSPHVRLCKEALDDAMAKIRKVEAQANSAESNPQELAEGLGRLIDGEKNLRTDPNFPLVLSKAREEVLAYVKRIIELLQSKGIVAKKPVAPSGQEQDERYLTMAAKYKEWLEDGLRQIAARRKMAEAVDENDMSPATLSKLEEGRAKLVKGVADFSDDQDIPVALRKEREDVLQAASSALGLFDAKIAAIHNGKSNAIGANASTKKNKTG